MVVLAVSVVMLVKMVGMGVPPAIVAKTMAALHFISVQVHLLGSLLSIYLPVTEG
jgi:hypothetical protein